MAFSDTQAQQLKAKLHAEHVKTRQQHGMTLHYVEGWHAIAEANRIFGFDGWDRRTLATFCVWSGMKAGQHCAAYTATVRVSVRAGDVIVVREGSGTGEANAQTIGQAHELALKGAETDATKRALATFGNPFGLALYDREQAGVRKARKKEPPEEITGPWTLQLEGSSPTTFTDADASPTRYATQCLTLATLSSSLQSGKRMLTSFAPSIGNLSRPMVLERAWPKA